MFHNNDNYELTNNPEERRNSAIQIINILKPITEEETNLFEYENISNTCRELCDPIDEYISDQRKKRLSSKIDIDIFLMSSFSKEFLISEEELKQNRNLINKNICNENLSIFNISKNKIDDTEQDEELINSIKLVLNLCGLEKWKEGTEAVKLPNEKKSSLLQHAKKTVTYETNIETNSMSGIWRMLTGETKTTGFPISAIGYNIFNDKHIDWLVRDDLMWYEKEFARKKCLNWLKKSHL